MAVREDLQRQFLALVEREFGRPLVGAPAVLTETDLERLPDPVARYVRGTGAVGRPRPRRMRVVLDATMRRRPGDPGFRAVSVQYSSLERPTRLFLMQARMFGLPVRALHVYREESATFRVRVASVKDMVDLSGPPISAAETVTVLNDLCLMAPGALVDERLSWTPVDDRSAVVRFRNGPHDVSATLVIDGDRLVDFVSDDRPEAGSGRFEPARWRTPMTRTGTLAGGLRLGIEGHAVYERPDGPFAYADMTIRSIDYDVAAPAVLPW
jgi:hypothetical protein